MYCVESVILSTIKGRRTCVNMKKSIIWDAINEAGKTISEFDVKPNTTDLEGSRKQLVKATAGVVLLAAVRSQYLTALAVSGLAITGAEYINHRFDVANKVATGFRRLNKVAVESVKIMKGVNENA